MTKNNSNPFESNSKIYNELAERRTIEKLGMSDSEIKIAKAFEITKLVELDNIKKSALNKNQKKSTIWSLFWNWI